MHTSRTRLALRHPLLAVLVACAFVLQGLHGAAHTHDLAHAVSGAPSLAAADAPGAPSDPAKDERNACALCQGPAGANVAFTDASQTLLAPQERSWTLHAPARFSFTAASPSHSWRSRAPPTPL